MPVNRLFLIAVPFVLAALAAGCLSRSSRVPVTAYTPPPPAAGASEEAYWRNLYEQRRPVPPERFSVPPKPPRDNSFGEFNDGLHQGLDAQPQLPRLPADSQAHVPPIPPEFREPATAGGGAVSPASARPAGPTRSELPQPSRLPGPGLAGIDTGAHFYPVEQLVYGGDYPDLDQAEQYRLMPRDQITITVRDHPEFSGPVTVQADGTVRPPNTPDLVRLRGLTVEEAAEALCDTLSVYIRGDCQVRIQANRAGGGYYFVFGDVLQPGRFPMGLEPVKLSDAILAANWEANPARRDVEGDDLGPSFPAANPRGRFVSPPSADLASVMLVTPHRSQPVRTFHDVRAAMTGMSGDDPLIRPGQIVIVPSLDERRNAGLPRMPEGLEPGRGYAKSDAPARLPEVTAPRVRDAEAKDGPELTPVEQNMEIAGAMADGGTRAGIRKYDPETDYPDYRERRAMEAACAEEQRGRKNRIDGW